jgi:DNA-binding transcriptional regulator YdaS (Cro superfamily)
MDANDPGLAKARQAAGGRNADLARLLGISPSAISQWVRVPYRRALQIEARTAGRVTRADLRPDLFGAPATGEAEREAPA